MDWLVLGFIFFLLYLFAGIIISYCQNNVFLQQLADDASDPDVTDSEIESRYFEDLLQDSGLAISACRILRYCNRVSLANKLVKEYKKRIDTACSAEAEHERLPID